HRTESDLSENRELELTGTFIATSFAIHGAAWEAIVVKSSSSSHRRQVIVVATVVVATHDPRYRPSARNGRQRARLLRAKLFDKAVERTYSFRNTIRIFPGLVFLFVFRNR